MKHFLAINAFILAGCCPAFPQASSTFSGATPIGLGVAGLGGSNGFSPIEQYDPFSGRVNIVVPLYHVGGRGEAGFDLVLPIPQTWRINNAMTTTWSPNPPTSGQLPEYSYTPQFQAPKAWSPGAPVISAGMVWAREGASYQACPWGATYPGMQVSYAVTKLAFTAPDGNETELVDTRSNGIPSHWDFPCSYNQPDPESSYPYRGTTFRSTSGGPPIEFVSDTAITDSFTPPINSAVSGYLYFPNGVVYRVDNSLVSWIKDRNGNQTTMTYTNNVLSQVTDSNGRVVSISYGNSQITITYPGFQNATRTITIGYEPLSFGLAPLYEFSPGIQTYNELFSQDTTDKGAFNPSVIADVAYPDGSWYAFQYNQYAEVTLIRTPAGGEINYVWGDGFNSTSDGYESNSTGTAIIYRRLQQRTASTSATGSNPTAQTNYSVSYYSNSTMADTEVTNPTLLAEVVMHTMNGSPMDALNVIGVACNAWNEGLEIRTDFGSPPAKTVTNTYVPQSGCMNNPQVASTTMTLDDTSQVSQATYLYDQYQNATDIKQYDWGNGSAGPLLRETQTAFLADSNSSYSQATIPPNEAYLLLLPSSQTVLDGSGNQAAQTLWSYDQTATQANSGMVDHDDTNYGTGFNYRGNLTSEQHWLNSTGGTVTIQRSYDVAGNVLTQQDPNGNFTTLSYADPQNTYAHITTGKNALNQSMSYVYDYSTSKVVSVTGLNGEQASFAYNDNLDRLTSTLAPNGAHTTYAYSNFTTTLITSDQTTANDGALQSQILTDLFGRPIETTICENCSQPISTIHTYNAIGAVGATTNPSRPNDGLKYPTSYSYDYLGRTTRIAASDGVTSTVSYSGNVTTVTDPAGNTKAYAYNALGELMAVAETVQSGSVVNTCYSYDALGDLVCVSQTACPSAPTRSFVYDSLRRLTKSVNPESGTVAYAYDNAGNPISRTDNRNVTTTFAYDKLNRAVGITYPTGWSSPNVTYTYDTGGSNSIGRLVGVSSTNSATNYTAFDTMGHVLSSNQTTLGTTYFFAYAYNLAGSFVSETYPSGRVISMSYDGTNRPTQISGVLQGKTTNYLSGAWYWPQGQVGYYTFRQ